MATIHIFKQLNIEKQMNKRNRNRLLDTENILMLNRTRFGGMGGKSEGIKKE